MGKTSFTFRQSGTEIQSILDTVPNLSSSVSALGIKVDSILPDYKNAESIDYATLSPLVHDRELVPGRWYIINDFFTKVKSSSTYDSEQLTFGIAVVALDEGTLSHHGYGVYVGDGDYGSFVRPERLEGIEVLYDFEPAANKYGFYPTTGGSGVVYWMRDKYGNEAPYDFLNIRFKRSDEMVPTFHATSYDSGKIKGNIIRGRGQLFDVVFGSGSHTNNLVLGSRISVAGNSYRNTFNGSDIDVQAGCNDCIFGAGRRITLTTNVSNCCFNNAPSGILTYSGQSFMTSPVAQISRVQLIQESTDVWNPVVTVTFWSPFDATINYSYYVDDEQGTETSSVTLTGGLAKSVTLSPHVSYDDEQAEEIINEDEPMDAVVLFSVNSEGCVMSYSCTYGYTG